MFGNTSNNKSNIYEREWSTFDREKFILDYFSVDREDLLKIDELNADSSTRMYLDKINMLLDTYAPLKRINKYINMLLDTYASLKRINKYKPKFQSKPSINLNKILKDLINKKDPILKKEFHTNYKKYTLHPYEGQ